MEADKNLDPIQPDNYCNQVKKDKDLLPKMSRRNFLKWLSAGSALLILPNCKSSKENKEKNETDLYFLEEPQDALSQQLISNWEMIYLDEFEKLNGHNKTGTYQRRPENPKLAPSFLLEKGWQRSGEYRQYIEKFFADRQLPLALVDNAFNESSWTYVISSYANAEGLYQFMPDTGRDYGLYRLNPYIDQRADPLLNAKAAAKYLSKSSAKYPNNQDRFSLALLAYHQGDAGLERCIKNCGEADFGKVLAYLEAGYQAAKIAYEKYLPTMKNVLPTDKRFEALEKKRKDLGKEVYRWQEKKNYVPKFFGIRRALYGKNSLVAKIKTNPPIEFDSVLIDYKQEEKETITVQSGQNLTAIAKQAGVSVKNLKTWNKLAKAKIFPGQKLKIFNEPPELRLGEIISKLNISREEIFGLNPAIILPGQKKKKKTEEEIKAIKNFDLGLIPLPKGYDLRLPKGKGADFVQAFQSELKKGTATVAEEFRVTDEKEIKQAVALQEKENLIMTPADWQYRNLLNDLAKGKTSLEAERDSLIMISDLYGKELTAGQHQETFVKSRQESIINRVNKIDKDLALEKTVGAEIKDSQNFIQKAILNYQAGSKDDLDELGNSIEAFEEALKTTENTKEKEECLSYLKDIRNKVKEIMGDRRQAFSQALNADAAIPADLIEDINQAYQFIEELDGLTKSDQENEGPDEVMKLLLDMVQDYNKRIKQTTKHQPTEPIKPKTTKKTAPVSSPTKKTVGSEKKPQTQKLPAKKDSSKTPDKPKQEYVVTKADSLDPQKTLRKIAEKFKISISRLCSKTKDLCNKPLRLKPGQKIKAPK